MKMIFKVVSDRFQLKAIQNGWNGLASLRFKTLFIAHTNTHAQHMRAHEIHNLEGCL